jgi:hypothetical protein
MIWTMDGFCQETVLDFCLGGLSGQVLLLPSFRRCPFDLRSFTQHRVLPTEVDMRGRQKNDDDRYAETIMNFLGTAGAVVWIRE